MNVSDVVTRAIEFVKTRPRVSALIAVLVALLGVMTAGALGKDSAMETLVVTPSEFVVRVADSGKVIPADEVSMAFEETGRVAAIYVEVGEQVEAGTALIALESGTLAADLASAEARVAVKRVELDNLGVNLEKVRKEEDTKVASAARTLLSEGLEAVPASNSYDTLTPPVVSGVYNANETGTYKVVVEREAVGSADVEIRVFDLERLDGIPVPDDEPVALGTRGLYLSFPDGASLYRDTIWYVNVPNVKSSSYLSNYNAYQEALRARDKAIADAEADLSERSVGQTIARAELAQAEADVARIRAELAKRVLRAPFSGVITAVDVEKGGAVSISDSAVSLISADDLEIESFIPETNISGIAVNDPAVVTLDAYGDTVPFSAKVVSIDPAETIRDGVSTYRVKLHFAEKDERIRSGMTANIVITTDARSGVLAVPQGIVQEKNGTKTVTVLVGGKKEERIVTTGAISSLGTVEILSGLSSGDIVLVKE